MRIAFICTEMLPSPAIRGGAIQVLIDGIAPFISEKHQLTIMGVKDPLLPGYEQRGPVEYLRVNKENYYQHISQRLRASDHPYDVIHVFNRPSNVPFYKAASPGSRFVVSLHNEMFKPGKLSTTEGLACLRSVHKVVTVSNFIGGTVTKRFPKSASKVQTVYSGVDPESFPSPWTPGARTLRENLRKSFGLQNKKVILFVGRLSENKGPHILIRALQLLAADYPNLVLVVVGSKWFGANKEDSYTRLLRQISAPIRDRIIFTGWVPFNKMPKYYLLGDIFVCASQWQEPLARVHYEAMAAGLPIITTNRGGNPEVIEPMKNGIVINAYNQPAEFAKWISFLLSNPLRVRQMGQRGRTLVESRYNFRRVARDLTDIYQQAYQSPATPVPDLNSIIPQRINRIRKHNSSK